MRAHHFSNSLSSLKDDPDDADDEGAKTGKPRKRKKNLRGTPATAYVNGHEFNGISRGGTPRGAEVSDAGFDDYQSSSSSEISDIMSIGSIATSLTSVAGGGTATRAAVDAFVDLIYSAVDLRQLIQPAFETGGIGTEKLTKGVRKLLRDLARDLSSELPGTENHEISKFLTASSRRLSSEIVGGLRDDRKEKQPKDEESGNSAPATESEDEEPEPVAMTDFSNQKDLIASTHSFNAFINRLHDLTHPSFRSQVKELVEWQAQETQDLFVIRHIKDVASELLYSQPEIITRSRDVASTSGLRRYINNKIPQDGWDWWPFHRKINTVSSGYSRITWKCVRILAD